MAISKNKNAAMPIDMAHECFFNRPMKSNISLHKTDENLLEIEAHYLPYRSKMASNLEIFLLGKEKQIQCDFMVNPNEARRENAEVKKYVMIFEKSDIFHEIFHCSPQNPAPLRSLTNVEASKEIERSILSARKLGYEQYKTFFTTRMVEKSTELTWKIKKTQLELFPSILEVKKKGKRRTLRVQNIID